MSKKRLPLKAIIMLLSVLLVTVPVIIFGIIEIKVSSTRAAVDVKNFVEGDVDTVYKNISTVYNSVQSKVKSDLTFAEYVFENSGKISINNEEFYHIEIVDQNTYAYMETDLPVMLAGDKPLAFNYEIVDEIQEHTGSTATIFQVIPDGLLRISTNVKKDDSSRAVGTFIPADSTVYSTVMAGNVFYGRAFVVNAWYITAYKPVYGENNEIIAVLYVGVKEDQYKQQVFQNLKAKSLGNSGYYEIIDTRGDFELAKDESLNGENSFNIRDAAGDNLYSEIVNKVEGFGYGASGSIEYPWKDSPEASVRTRSSFFVYFEPWDWVVIANIYNDDLVRERIVEDLIRIVTLIAVFVALGIILSFITARGISRPLIHAQHSVEKISSGNLLNPINMRTPIKELFMLGESVDRELIPRISGIIRETFNSIETSGKISKILHNYSDDANSYTDRIKLDVDGVLTEMASLDNQISEVSAAVTEILATIENLVTHIDSQSSAVTQTSAAVEEMTASLGSISRISAEKADATNQLVSTVEEGRGKITESNKQIRDISADVDNMMDIIGVINSIAAQTNLLAMNAAIEAAHAGEYGMGFSVVADEIRKLAESASQNAKVISTSLKEAVGKMSGVISAGEDGAKAFGNVASEVMNFINAFTEITQSTNEVSEGSREILSAVDSLMQVSQEISSGSSEIKLSAGEINNSVNQIKDSSHSVVHRLRNVNDRTGEIAEAQTDMLRTVDWNTLNIGKVEENVNFFEISSDETVSEKSRLNLELAEILISHQEWVANVGDALAGNYKIDLDKAGDYTSCKMGTWIEEKGRDLFGDSQDFEVLEREHVHFHESVARIGTYIENSQEDKLLKEYAAIRKCFHYIMTSFMNLIEN